MFSTISILMSCFKNTRSSWMMTKNCCLSSVDFLFAMNYVIFLLLGSILLSHCSDVYNIFYNKKEAFAAYSEKTGAEGEVTKETKNPVLHPALLTKIRRFRRFDVCYLFHFWVISKFFWCIPVLLIFIW